MTDDAREARWWIFSGRALLLRQGWAAGDQEGSTPDPRPTKPLPSTPAATFESVTLPLGSGFIVRDTDATDGVPAQALAGGTQPAPPAGYDWVDLRAAASALGPEFFREAGRAWQLVEWRRTHRFCGVCGEPTAFGPYDALACTRCDHLHFPRLSPAVIVLVHDGDRALLGRGRHLPEGMYSTLAGFVEPGESLEEAVHREIREEADVEVDDVRYVGSQPWPFPHSLMVGFTARWVSGTPRPADGELDDVRWFARDALPRIPGRISIARTLIDRWREGDAG